MHITIENLLGVRRADINLDGIVEVVGPNASGKTSVALCAQALLAHEANPLGVPAPQARTVYPHNGDADGYAHIEGVDWRPGRGGLSVVTGVQSYARPEAVGLIDFTARTGEKARLEAIQSAILPDVADIVDALREELLKRLPPADVDGVLDVIGKRGFEAAEGIYAERGRESKRQWAEVTGRTYGVRVAADWRPGGWLADMDAMTTGQAEEAITAAREALAALHQVQAVTEAEQDAAQRAKDALPELREQVDKLDNRARQINADIAAIPTKAADDKAMELDRKLSGMQRELNARHQCPHCGGALAIADGKVVDGSNGPSHDNEVAGVINELREAREHLQTLHEQIRPLSDDYNAVCKTLEEARREVAMQERIAAKTGEVLTAERRDGLAQAEQAVDDAKRIADMVAAEAKALDLSQTIARYAEVVRALGPQGVRAKMMESGLRLLNSGLKALSDEADWPLVTVTDRGAVSWGGRPVALCSESERWRAQACIQLTLAAITGSQAIVLDRADLLDPGNRKGLVRAIQRVSSKTGIAVLLCSTGEVEANTPWTQVAIDEGRTRKDG